ncbi:unnamed protein product [Commensalibacter communis]|uniref:rolling circle replication-associated protein n=1 Tax=Commensalibacter communis TaxID=2972786 RepID=UPI0022FFB9EA|nr:hypothetical protein [Commensalibacter communis]CAI3947572.1 unnamed protein product [Commensalibacter communis]
MLYKQIELILRYEYPKVWKQLFPLHYTYKNIITKKIKESCEFLACYEENEQVAIEFVEWFRTVPKDIKSSFELISLSFDELKERKKQGRNKKKNLTIQANALRRNFRRFIKLTYEDDIWQKQFDVDKQNSEKSYIIIPASNDIENGLSAYDVKQFNISRQIAINLDILGHLESFCNTYLSFKGFFLTLTLPQEFQNCSYEEAREEITKRWKRIKSSLKYRDILYLGVEVIELQKNETPHYHIQLWINPQYEQRLKLLIHKHFSNEAERFDKAVKTISDAIKIMKYCCKDKKKDNSKSYTSFIGLKKDIRARYNSLYHNKKYKELSDYRTYKANKIIHYKVSNYLLLLLIRGFSDDRLNSLSSRHPDKYYILTDKQNELVINIFEICNNEYYFKLNNNKIFIYNIFELYRSKYIYYIVICYIYYIFLLSLLYITKKVYARLVFDYQCDKSKGQPPPCSYI